MTLIDQKWIEKHRGEYADWHPTIEIIRPGSKLTITIKSKNDENRVIKMLKADKRK